MRWYLKVFFHLIDVSIWNASWLYRNYVQKITYLEARETIIEAFLKDKPNKAPKKQKTRPK